MSIQLSQNHIYSLNIGDQVTVSGVVMTSPERNKSFVNHYLEVNSIKRTLEEVETSDAKDQMLRNFSSRDDVLKLILRNLAPETQGFYLLKTLLLLMQISQQRFNSVIFSSLNNEISQILKFFLRISPKKSYYQQNEQ